MLTKALGTIEVLGLPAAIEAADVACKTADVTLIGYETTDGMGMVAVKIEGQVSAVQAAVSAACAAAGRLTKVFATSVIPRPNEQLAPVVLTEVTIGLAPAKQPRAAKPKAGAAETKPAQPAQAAEPRRAEETKPAPEPTAAEPPVIAAEPTPAKSESASPAPVSPTAAKTPPASPKTRSRAQREPKK